MKKIFFICTVTLLLLSCALPSEKRYKDINKKCRSCKPVAMATFNKIKIGMDYQDARKLLGKPKITRSRGPSNAGRAGIYGRYYQWIYPLESTGEQLRFGFVVVSPSDTISEKGFVDPATL